MIRRALCMAGLSVVLFAGIGHGQAIEMPLPEGSSPTPIASGYFPSRLHECVWRNWNVIEPKRLAKVLGASVEDVTAVAESMGLPPAGSIPPDMTARAYVTILRRNWHLLPYDQLLELLGMKPEQLALALQEDDSLWTKLGSSKPKCEPLHYAPPDEAARRRAAEIRQVVEQEFGDELRRPAEPRFDFVRKLSAVVAEPPKAEPPKTSQPLRVICSCFGIYGDTLLNAQLDPYPEGLLQRLSALGINGVWLPVVLRDMAPGGTEFPEFGVGHEKRLANLRATVARAKQYGIDVYLYVNEPRAMPAAFFRNRPEMAGLDQGGFTAMCPLHPAVRKWMSDSLAYVFHEVHGLGGVFTVTDSHWKNCPHCKNRTDAEIVVGINAAIEEGVHRGNPKAKMIVWDWRWQGHVDDADVVARLPKSAWLMSVSEWGVPLNRGDVQTTVNDYSISEAGPGLQAKLHWMAARAAGLKTVAKVQVNNSWELASLPYLPVMNLVADQCRRLADADLDGTMLSWTPGGYPSPNLEIAARLSAKPTSGLVEVLNAVAVEHYGQAGAPAARQAWGHFSVAMYKYYPFDTAVLRRSPMQWGPASPLYLKKTGYEATELGFPYDDVNAWRGPYPATTLIDQFERMAEEWRLGLGFLQTAADKAPAGRRREEAQADLRLAKAAALYFQSVANQTAFVVARDLLAERGDTLSSDEWNQLHAVVRRRLQSEIMLARRLFTLSREDSRIGFEPANQYFYLPLDLVEKVVNCRWLLDQMEQKPLEQK